MIEVIKIIGTGIAATGLIGAGVGIGVVLGALIIGVARNPSLRGQLFSYVGVAGILLIIIINFLPEVNYYLGLLLLDGKYLMCCKYLINSSFFNDVLIPILGIIFIFLSLLGIGGIDTYLELGSIFIKIFKYISLKNKLFVEKYFQIIIAFIIIFYISISTIAFMTIDFNIFYYLIEYIPITGLVLLSLINKKLVKDELVHRISVYWLMLTIGFILGVLFFLLIFIYEPKDLNNYFSLFMALRSFFAISILIFILRHLFYMPWNKKNWIKTGVLFFSLWLVGGLVNTTGKLSYFILNKENNYPFIPENISLDIEEVDMEKLRTTIFPDINIPSEDLKEINPYIFKSRKASIFDYIPSCLKYSRVSQPLVKGNYSLGSLPKISLFNGFISLDLNKPPIKSPLLRDTRLYDFSPPLWITRPELFKRFIPVRYDPYLGEGFYIINSDGYTQYNQASLEVPWDKDQMITGNVLFLDNLNQIRDIKIIFDLSLLQYKNLLAQAKEYYYLKTSIRIKVPIGFQIDNLRLNPIITERLIIRPMCYSDAVGYAFCSAEPESSWNLGLSYDTKSIYDAKRQIESDIKYNKKYDDIIKLAVLLKGIDNVEGKFIGTFGAAIDPSGFGTYIYYQLSKNYWSQGYGTELLEGCVQYYFNLPFREAECKLGSKYIDVNKYNGAKLLIADTFTFNERSANLLKKCGFKLWHSDVIVRWKEDNDLTRLLEKRGYDLRKDDGYGFFRWFKYKLDPINTQYIWPKFIIMPGLSKDDGFFIFKYRNLYRTAKTSTLDWLKLYSDKFTHPVDMKDWILSEDDFYKRK